MRIFIASTRYVAILGSYLIVSTALAQFGTSGLIFDPLSGRVPLIADMNGDNYPDVVLSTESGPELVWFESIGGEKFAPPRIISPDTASVEVLRAADLDGDGDQDLVYLRSDGSLYEIENLGGMAFGPKQQLADSLGSGWAYGLSIADLDGDQLPDIVVCHGTYLLTTLSWLRNLGNGQFDQPITIISNIYTSNTMGMDCGDIDQDGDIDLLVAGNYPYLTWLANNGDGTFGVSTTISNGAYPFRGIRLADLDGDGDLDVVANQAGSAQRIVTFMNEGAGAFGTMTTLPTYSTLVDHQPNCVDIDGDGDNDLIIAEHRQSQGSVSGIYAYHNQGDGTFSSSTLVLAQGYRYCLATDLDLDGDPDLLVAGDYNLLHLKNDGTGSFSLSSFLASYAQEAPSFSIQDLDNDGDNDILTAMGDGISVGPYASIFVNNGSELFDTTHYLFNGTSGYEGVVVLAEDMDGDGLLDLIGAAHNGVFWRHNEGGGVFGAHQYLYSYAQNTPPIATADLDGDGDQDLLISNVSHSIRWVRNDGNGTFESQPQFPILAGGNGGYSYGWIQVGDINGDQKPDFVCSSSQSSTGTFLKWYRNDDVEQLNGVTGSVISADSPDMGTVVLGDVDGDGDLDLIFEQSATHDVVWKSNDGNGVFAADSVLIPGTSNILRMRLVDIDNDGDNDLLIGNDNGDVQLYENLGAGTMSTDFTTILSHAYVFDLGDVDSDGDQDVVYLDSPTGMVRWLPNLTTGLSTSTTNLIRSENGLRTMPMPFTDLTTLVSETPFEQGDQLEIRDMAGRLVGHQILNAGRSCTIQRDGLLSGMYLLTVHGNNGVSRALRIVAE